jgi:archaellum component FlaC
MEAEIESHRQNAINSERKAAEDARESITFQKVNEELLLKLNDKSTKLESLSKDFNKISLFTRGLGTDLSRGNGKLLRVNEEIKSLVDERELLKSQYCLFESQITQSRLEIQELRSKYRELLTEAESTKRGLESEIVCFQAKLEEKELLLAREIEINTSAHRAEYWNQRLQNHVEELLNATKEHLTSKLGEFVAQQEPPSPSREEMSVLKVLLEEIHSRHYVTLHDLKALEATLGGLWMK